MHYLFPILTILIFGGLGYSSAFAHTTVHVEQYEIEVGWDIEPPVVGFRNVIVYEISESPSAEGAGAGDDQHRDESQQGLRQPGIRPDIEPDDERREGHQQHRRDKEARHLIGQALDRRFAALRLAHEPDDLLERGLGPDTRHLDDEGPRSVDRPSHDRVVFVLIDG